MSNARVVEVFKLIDRIDIAIEPFSSYSKIDDENENLKPSPASNTLSAPVTTLLNKVNSTGIKPDHSIE